MGEFILAPPPPINIACRPLKFSWVFGFPFVLNLHVLRTSSTAAAMKDFLSPLATPFALSNALDTPSKLDANHYFAPSHHLSGAQVAVQADEQSVEGEASKFRLSVLDARSAVDAMPNELLSLIVEAGYFTYDEASTYDSEFRSLLLQVSRRFREVTLHTPSVWSVIRLSQGNVEEEIQKLPVYLERSRDHPLDIHMSAFWRSERTDVIMSHLLPHSKRWRRACIITPNAHILSYLPRANATILEDLEVAFFSHLRRVNLPPCVFGSHTPRLSRLCLRNVDLDGLDIPLQTVKTLEIRGYGGWPSISRFNEMLRGSASLEKLILHVKPGQTLEQLYAGPENQHGHITLPNLRKFDVFTSEWLSNDISALFRVFACPKIEDMTLREGSGPYSSQQAKTIMSYTTGQSIVKDTRLFYQLGEPLFDCLPRHLFVHSANLSYAHLALSSSTITSLEIRQVSLPPYDLMKSTFASLNNLKHLFLLGIYPNHALTQMLDNIEPEYFDESAVAAMDSTIRIPSLETLMIDFHHPTWTVLPRDYSAEFIRIFSLPSLHSLILKDLKALQWSSISASFANSTSQYPKLASLKLIDMTDMDLISPASYSLNTAVAFPNLRRLSLDSIPSNPFVHQLLPEQHMSDPSSSLPWPNLEELAICNDPNASKPLLHRVITTRESIGRPLKKLCLDEYFYRNLESINWIKEHVEVFEAERTFL